jgi:hypothetical protein
MEIKNEKKILIHILLLLSILFVEFAYAEQKKCHTKTEVGESIIGTSNIYETTEKLNPSKFSIFDFDNLIVTNPDNGSTSKIKKISTRVYTSLSSKPFQWFYITNDTGTIVTEVSLNESVVYTKILFCQ